MTAPHADQLIDGYLARLRDAAGDLPRRAQRELADDMRTHIAEARGREPQETDATILNILDRLGEPDVVVAEARERLGLRSPTPYRPGVLEIIAVILVPFFWPVGVILLWISPAWKPKDKVIGSLVPPGGYLGVGILGVSATGFNHSGSGCLLVTDTTGHVMQNTCPPVGPSWLQAAGTAVLTLIIFVLPLLTAAYLAIRLRWGRRSQVPASA
jgi:HAAS domain-containing protein